MLDGGGPGGGPGGMPTEGPGGLLKNGSPDDPAPYPPLRDGGAP